MPAKDSSWPPISLDQMPPGILPALLLTWVTDSQRQSRNAKVSHFQTCLFLLRALCRLEIASRYLGVVHFLILFRSLWIAQTFCNLGASRESLPCGQLLSFLQKNIISATVAMAAVLLVTVLVVFTLVTYKRRRQTK